MFFDDLKKSICSFSWLFGFTIRFVVLEVSKNEQLIFKNHFRLHLKTSYSSFTRYYICMKLIGTFGRSTRQRYEKQHQYFSRKFERGRFVCPFNMHTDRISGSQFWSSGLATRWTHVWVQFFFKPTIYIYLYHTIIVFPSFAQRRKTRWRRIDIDDMSVNNSKNIKRRTFSPRSCHCYLGVG